MEGVIFRPARPDEIDRLSDIVNDPPSQATLNIAGSLDKAIRGGRVLTRRGLSLQLEQTTVAEINGKAIGVMDACANRRDPDVGIGLVLRLLLPTVRTIGFDGLWRLLRSRSAWARVAFDQVPGAYHIAELDIDDRYRNRGIGAAFLRLAEERARAEGCALMSLTTDVSNPAQHLYERAGFRVVETKLDAEYERWSLSPGRVLMLKELAPIDLRQRDADQVTAATG
jgi:ribosomal protein S18 acetylase RimI-like enzyme